MAKQEFRARFLQRYADEEREYKDEIIKFDALNEKGLKPNGCFVWKKGIYIYSKDHIKSYDVDGRPIIKFYRDNALPVFSKQAIIDGKTFVSPELLKEMNLDKKAKLDCVTLSVPNYIEEEPLIEEQDILSGLKRKIKISAHLLYQTFSRGEMKSVIAASQKEPQKFDWLTILMGVFIGAPIGLLVGFALYPHLFHVAAAVILPAILK